MKQKILFSTLFAVVLGLFIAVTPVKAAGEKCNGSEDNSEASIIVSGVEKYCPTLKDAVDEADANSTITLLKDVELSSNIGINKSLTIDGKNFTIQPTSMWKGQEITSEDQSLITVANPGDVTLQNVVLKDSKKYGAQAFNGGKLTLKNVTISGCGYGAILANGGTVTVKNVTLGKNGADKNVGIEIAKNKSSYANPELIMDGIINSSEEENVVWIAVNDELETFTVDNTDDSEQKIYTNGNKVVVTNNSGEVLYSSNENQKVTPIAEDDQPEVYVVTIVYDGKEISAIATNNQTLLDLDKALNLTSIKKGVNGKVFVKFVDENGKDYDESSKITSDIKLTAVYEISAKGDGLDKTPKTGNNNLIGFISIITLISLAGVVTLKKRMQ